jgi:hypothetical protein
VTFIRGFESDGGILRDIEKIGTFEVGIALGFTGIDSVGVDGHIHGGFVDVLVIPVHRSGDTFKLSTHGGDHHVLDGKSRRRVSRINLPRSGDGRRRNGQCCSHGCGKC